MRVGNQGVRSKRLCITKTDAAYSLLDFHLSLVNETESEELAAQALLDLEGSCHANTTQSTDNANDNENSDIQECNVDTTVVSTAVNTENKCKEVATQINTKVVCIKKQSIKIRNFTF